MEPAELSSQLVEVMQAAQGKPPGVSKIRPTIKAMQGKLARALGKDNFNIVVGVPLHLSIGSRNEVHTELHKAGFRVLSTVRQPALASRLFSFHRQAMPKDLYTTLVVEYNRAALSLSITPTAHGASDLLASASFPQFGMDALDFKIASLMFNDTVDGRDWAPLGALSKQIRLLRNRAVDNETHQEIRLQKSNPLDEAINQRQQPMSLKNLDLSAFQDRLIFDQSKFAKANETERRHYMGILDVLDEFVNQHSYNTDFTMGSAWNPRLSEKSNMLLSGDADSSGFQAFRKILDDSDVDWPLAKEQESPEPREVAAKGAAIDARSRMQHDEDEKKKKQCLEKLLQDEDHRQKVKLVVPHDL